MLEENCFPHPYAHGKGRAYFIIVSSPLGNNFLKVSKIRIRLLCEEEPPILVGG